MFALNKTRRRVIFWLFVAVFLLAAPLLIAYSQGLRYDFSRWEVVRVGAIALDSEPEDARIIFDEEVYDNDTPTVIRGLLPDRIYDIRVELDGFFPWTKALSVEAQRITAARGIHLFPRELIFEEVATNTPSVTTLYISENGERIFGVDSQQSVSVYNIRNATTTSLIFPDTAITQNIENVQWHDDNEQLLFSRRLSGNVIWYTWNTEENLLTNLNNNYSVILAGAPQAPTPFPAEFDAQQVSFARSDGTRLLAALNGRMYLMNMRDRTIEDLGLDSIAVFYASRGRFFLVNASGTLVEVRDSGDIVRAYGELGFIPERLLLSPNGQRLLYESNGRAEIIWLERQELDWRRQRGDIDLLFDVEGSPTRLWWHGASGYVLLWSSDGRLEVVEIDVRDKQNMYGWDFDPGVALSYGPQGRLWQSINGLVSQSEEEF